MPVRLEEINQQIFWADFYEIAAKKGTPFKTSLELTYRCNLKCRHCYVVPDLSKEELSFEEVRSTLAQLESMGCFHLNLTGGEVFTRGDIFEIVEFAKKKGFFLILLTNGTLITPKIADRLKDLGIDQVDISLYGVSERTYESITRVPGSFQRCVEGIRLLKRKKIPILLKMTVMNLNVAEFDEVKALARKLNVPFRYGYFIQPKIDGSKDPLAFRLSPREALVLETKNQPHLLKEEKETQKKKVSSLNREAFFPCTAGRNSMAITPYGEMNVCLEYRFPKYNLRKGNVASGWKELGGFIKSARPSRNYQCKNCDLWEFCQCCPAEGWLNEGDPSACVPYFKELARIKKEWMEKT